MCIRDRVDVLCVDKTGTITENSMSVNKLVPTEEYDKENMPELSKLVGDFVKAMSSDNSTMEAMKEYFKEGTGAVPAKVCLLYTSGRQARNLPILY